MARSSNIEGIAKRDAHKKGKMERPKKERKSKDTREMPVF